MKKSVLLICAGIALVAGCTRVTTVAPSFQAEEWVGHHHYPASDSVGMQVCADVTYYLSYQGSEKKAAALNALFNRFVFGEECNAETGEDAFRFFVGKESESYFHETDAMYDEYEKFAAEEPGYGIPDYVFRWRFERTGALGGSFGRLQTYDVTIDSYMGGAHGTYEYLPHLFDTKTLAEVKEADLFAEGYKEPLARLLQQKAVETEPYDEYYRIIAESGEADELNRIQPNGIISVDEAGATWHFQQYEVGPYALGLVDVTLPWSDLKPYLNPVYAAE